LSKVDEKVKSKGKDHLKEKNNKGKKKETRTCNHCEMKGHIKVNCWKKNPLLMPEKFKGKKTEQKRLERRWKKSIFYQWWICAMTSASFVWTLKLLMYWLQSHPLIIDSEM
jgi:hypothetical protein